MPYAVSDRLPPGDRVYAIGDLHGRADLLDQMATLVEQDLDNTPGTRAHTVFLGDYIDRGPDSAAVIERLVERRFPTPILTLRGNHEQMLLDGLTDPDAFDHWIENGGPATMRSYARDGQYDTSDPDLYTSEVLSTLLPPAHLAFLEATRLSLIDQHHFYCHAGIRPGVPLDAQDPQDLLWIREPFHSATRDYGWIVVHGHTPEPKPDLRHNRINVDTGAFKTGVLTCVVLGNEPPRFLQVRAP